tara:strand:+ start:365 stop:577 length:213 start_codon:yes stop_codon:yes gene_type:complete
VSNVIYLPHPKENLLQKEVEQAMRLIYKAWESQQAVKIPWQLMHLTEQQWEMLEEALDDLFLEQEQSQLH